jgi:hypothetical protein
MHESIAKAETKGTFRVANQKLDAFNHNQSNGTKLRHSKKSVTQFVDDIVNVYGDLLLRHDRKNKRSSWHFESELVAFDPDPTYENNLGTLHEMVIEYANTKNLLKGKSGYRYFNSVFYVHEHFFQRLLQRTNRSDKSDFYKLFVNVVFCLANNVKEFKTDSDTCHIVYKEIVLVINFVQALNMIVFKTVLLKSRFTERQANFYENAYIAMADNGADCFVCLFPESRNIRVENVEKIGSALEMAVQFPKQFPENQNFNFSSKGI